jgi:hypothetical protein
MTTLNGAIPLGDGRETSEDTDTHRIVSAADDPRDLTDAERAEDNQQHDDAFLNEHAGNQANERWQHIQAQFVDDPRASVSGAHQLVGELVQHITDTFTKERNELEHQWSKGESVSTEDLRVCLQRYRSFFTRLLPLGEKPIEDR